MNTTRLFSTGNSQEVRSPAELEIERHRDEITIRPARRSLVGVLSQFARCSPDFMVDGGRSRMPCDGALDKLIAAHAVALGVTLVANNLRDFARYPVLSAQNWLKPDPAHWIA